MKTLTLQINDEYFDKIVSFLELLPKKAVKIKQQEKEEKLMKIEEELISAAEDINQGRTKRVRIIV